MKSFETTDFKQNYKFLIGAIVPRPIAFVSTCNSDGSFNLAPFSFFTAISADPMVVAFCPLIRTSTGQKKDTVVNIERQKQFVISFVTQDIVDQVNLASTELAYGEDEFQFTGLTPLPSECVAPPRVKESPIHYECELADILSYGDHVGAGRLISGKVLRVHVREDLLDEGRILTDQFAPIGRGAGNDWIRCTDLFQLERQMKAQIQK